MKHISEREYYIYDIRYNNKVGSDSLKGLRDGVVRLRRGEYNTNMEFELL